jgi:hypothetical protein
VSTVLDERTGLYSSSGWQRETPSGKTKEGKRKLNPNETKRGHRRKKNKDHAYK